MKLRLVGFLIVLGIIITGCTSKKHFIEGTVVDFQTLKPLPNTEVSVNQTGWGFSNGRLVWDKSYVYKTMSDSNGNFRIEYDVGSSADVKAEKSDYIPYNGWHAANSTITIKLKGRNPNYTPLPHGFLEIGVKNFKPYGWIFSEQRTTFNREEADIFPKFDENFSKENVILETPKTAGIAFISKDELGVGSNFLIYTDTAPARGYVAALALNFNGPEGVYFVKTRNGNFAKFSYTTASDYGLKQGNWSLALEYVYNPDGTRDLEFQR